MPEIDLIIDSNSGEFRLHVHGVAGPACDAIAGLLKELTGPPGSEDATSEYYLRPVTQVRTVIRPRSKHS